MNHEYTSIGNSPIRFARRPVDALPILYDWNSEYESIINLQIDLIREDLKRQQSQHKYIIYLSCPISARGGGHEQTNVEISSFIERKIIQRWGSNVWVLNPTEYQLNTSIGFEKFKVSIERAEFNRKIEDFVPTGADYMRMWTKILAEDYNGVFSYGSFFNGYYFLGPKDVAEFFSDASGGENVIGNIESYLSKRLRTDEDFKNVLFDHHNETTGLNHPLTDDEKQTRLRRFVEFYALKAGANYSKGCHDEWNIWVEINKKKIMDSYARRNSNHGDEYGVGNQIPGYWDGAQISLGSSETNITEGYGFMDNNLVELDLGEWKT